MNMLNKDTTVSKALSMLIAFVLAVSLVPIVASEQAWAEEEAESGFGEMNGEEELFSDVGFNADTLNSELAKLDSSRIVAPYGDKGQLTAVNELHFEWEEPDNERNYRVTWGIDGELNVYPSSSTGYRKTSKVSGQSAADWITSVEFDYDGDGRKNEIAYLRFYHDSADTYYRYNVQVEDADGWFMHLPNSSGMTNIKVSDDNLKTLWDKGHIVSADVNNDTYDELIITVNKHVITLFHDGSGENWQARERKFNRNQSYLKYYKGYDTAYTSPWLDESSGTVSVSVGDINNDGYDDIAYTASAIRKNPAGTVYLGEVLFGGEDAPSSYTSKPLPLPDPGEGSDSSKAPGRLGVTITNYDGDRYPDILLAWEDITDIRFNRNDTDGFVAKTYNVNWITYTYVAKDVKAIGDLRLKAQILSNAEAQSSGDGSASNKSYGNVTNTAALRIAKADVLASKNVGKRRIAVMINGAVHLIDSSNPTMLNTTPYYNITDPQESKSDKRGVNNNTAVMNIRTGTTNGANEGFLVQWIKNESGDWAQVGSSSRYSLEAKNRQCVVFWNGQELELAKQVSREHLLYACLPDVDNDSIILEYQRHDTLYTDPEIAGVLAAPLYYEDLKNTADVKTYSTSGAATTIELSTGTGSGETDTTSYSLGAYGKVDFDIGSVVKFHFETELTYNHTWTETTETMKTTTVYKKFSATSASGDAVVLYTVPVDIYTYKAYVPQNGGKSGTWEEQEMVIVVPAGPPQHISMSIETYNKNRNKVLENEKYQDYVELLPDINGVFDHIEGDPGSYPQTAPASDDPNIKQDTVVTSGSPVSSLDNTTHGVGITMSEQTSITKTEANSIGFSIGAGVSWDAKVFQGTAAAGMSFGWDNIKGTIETSTESQTYSYDIVGTPRSFGDYSFNSSLLGYIYQIGRGDEAVTFPVVTYIVNDSSRNLVYRLPTDYGPLPDEATTDSVAVYWEPSLDDADPGDDSAFVYNVYTWNDSLGSKVSHAGNNKLYSWNEDEGRYELTITNAAMRPSTQYQFVIRVEKDGNEGVSSGVIDTYTISDNPVRFVTQPQNITLNDGAGAKSLVAQVTNPLPNDINFINATWQRWDGSEFVDLANPAASGMIVTDFSGEGVTTLTFDTPRIEQHGIYRVAATVTPAVGEVYSEESTPAQAFWSPETPAAPVVDEVTSNSITLAAIPSGEYRIDYGDWQESPEFSGLSMGTGYSFQQRIRIENGTNDPIFSLESSVTTATTLVDIGSVEIISMDIAITGDQDVIDNGSSYEITRAGLLTATVTDLSVAAPNEDIAQRLLAGDFLYKWQRQLYDNSYEDVTEWIAGADGGNTYDMPYLNKRDWYHIVVKLPDNDFIGESKPLFVNTPALENFALTANGEEANILRLNDEERTAVLGVVVWPSDYQDREFELSISEGGEQYVSIDSAGIITALADTPQMPSSDEAPVIITASLVSEPGIYDSIGVWVVGLTTRVDEVSITGGDNITDPDGGTLQLSATITPDTAANKDIVWSIDEGEEFASVDEDGLVTASAIGRVVVRASAQDGSEASDTQAVYITDGETIRFATIANVRIEGLVGTAMPEQRAYITLSHDSVAEDGFVGIDASSWFTNLAEGVSVAAFGDEDTDLIELVFSGLPTAISTESFVLSIPAEVLGSGEGLTVNENSQAAFRITSIAPQVVDKPAIQGVTVPTYGGTPSASIVENDQYSGTVEWIPIPEDTFAAEEEYMAVITLSAKEGYTFFGVAENFFTLAGAQTVGNAADSGIVTAEFAPIAAKAVSVGVQDITPIAGSAGSVSYDIQTTSIANGRYPVTLSGAPEGVMAGYVSIYNSEATLTLNTTDATPQGTHSLTLTIDETVSHTFTLTIDAAPYVPTVFVGEQDRQVRSGSASTVDFEVAVDGVADGTYSITTIPEPTLILAGTPAGVVAQDLVISNGAGILTLDISAEVLNGAYPLTITLNGITSNTFSLVVDEPKTVVVGQQTDELSAGTAGVAYFSVLTTNIDAGSTIVLDAGSTDGITLADTPSETSGDITSVGISITNAVAQGTYPLTLVIDSVTSNTFNLLVGSPPIEATYGIALSQSGVLLLPSLAQGYDAAEVDGLKQTITVINTGNQETGALEIALTLVNPPAGLDDAFTVSKTGIESLAAGGSDTFTAVPKADLSEGTYRVLIEVKGNTNIDTKSFFIDFTVSAATIDAIELITPPKLAYFEGEALDLSDLGIRLTMSDETTRDVGVADFSAYGIAMTYPDGGIVQDGDVMTVAGHNGAVITLASAAASLTLDPLSVEEKTYTITLTQAMGATAVVSHTEAKPGTPITVSITSYETDYRFVSWTITPNATWTQGDETSDYATFTMPDEGVGITPAYEFSGIVVTPPSTPQNLVATPGDGQVALDWDIPADDGGSSIIRYEISVDNSSWDTTTTETDYLIENLTNGVEYTFYVRAVNAEGEGPAASVSETPTSTTPGDILVSGITVSGSTHITAKGATTQLSALVTPTDATNKNVTWLSSNEAVATVNANGMVTAKANGETTITATSTDGTNITGSLTVTVSGQEEDATISYYFKDGIRSHTLNSGQPIILIIDKDISLFSQALVGGTPLVQGQFNLSEGSTVLTFNAGFLSSLAAGTHTLRVEFSDDTFIEDTFTVAARTDGDPGPGGTTTPSGNGSGGGGSTMSKTGDSSANLFAGLGMLVIISGLLIAYIAVRQRRKGGRA